MTNGSKSGFQLTRLAASYNEIQGDGRILSNRKAMEIIWMRIQQLAERIDLNDAPERMEKIQALWKELREKEEAGKQVEAQVVANEIDKEFEAAYHDYMSWRQMFQALELHSKMTESEVKIMKDMRVIMTAEDAYELVAKVMAVFLKILQDEPRKLKEAQYELNRLVGGEIDSRFGGRSREGGGVPRPGGMDRETILDTGDEERSETSGTDKTGSIPEGRDPGDIQPG